MAALYATNPRPTTLPTHELLGFKPDESVATQVNQIAQSWLTDFEVASKSNDAAAFADLFAEDSFWRELRLLPSFAGTRRELRLTLFFLRPGDIIAFTNDYRTLRGANILQAAKVSSPAAAEHRASLTSALPPQDRLKLVAARDLVFAKTQPSLQHPFEDVSFINIHFDFATATGPAYGIANLVRSPDGKWRAYLLFTLLEGIHDHPERVGANRARGTHNDKESYDTRRAEESEFAEQEPTVLIGELLSSDHHLYPTDSSCSPAVGAGHNGLSLAARLKAIGTEALVIDKQKRTGGELQAHFSC